MKICHCTSVHPATDARIFFKECTSLAKQGYEVYLVVANAKSEIKHGVHIVGINVKGHGRFNRLLSVDKAVWKKALEIDADIYHFHDPELLRYALRLKKKGKKVIFDSHEDVVSQILQKKYLSIFRFIISFFYARYEKYVLSKIDAIISVTPHIVNRLRKINVNTYQITNYPLQEELYEYQNIQRVNNKIVFAGGISSLWLHDNVLKALKYVSEDVTYAIAGSGNKKYLDFLQSLESWERVEYLGIISRQEVLRLYRGSLLGIAIMDYVANVGYHIGTLGNNKLFEFMSAGLPIICTDFVLWKEIIDKWKCGIYVNAYDVYAISKAINEIYSNPEMARQMGQNGIQAIKTEYNWATQEKVLLELYERLDFKQK